MRTFTLIFTLLFSSLAYAETYLIYEINQNVRVVLNKKPCLVSTLTGNAAALQTTAGKFVRGCWHIDRNNSDHIRIDWDNPAAPGDFAVIPAVLFTAVDK